MPYVTTHDELKKPCPASPREDKAHVARVDSHFRGLIVFCTCLLCDKSSRREWIEAKQ